MTTPAIAHLLDGVTLSRFGLTRTEALRLGCCVRCRRDVDPSSLVDIDRMEWHLSALCPACYASITEEDCE
jgi:hypothetical protein